MKILQVALLMVLILVITISLIGCGGGRHTAVWSYLGTGPIAADAYYSAALSIYNGTPYIAYPKYDNVHNTFTLTVKKFNSATSSWIEVGAPSGITHADIIWSLCVYGPDQFYVLYHDNFTHEKVASYNGSWSDLGFSSSTQLQHPSILVDPNEVTKPYVEYHSSMDVVYVKQYYGGGWNPVGGISVGSGTDSSFFIYNGTPYVSYENSGPTYGAVCKKLNAGGTAWDLVGPAEFSMQDDGLTIDDASCTSLFVSNENGNAVPYVGYYGYEHSKASVYKYSGTPAAWHPVGARNFSPETVQYVKIYVYNGTCYLMYQGDTGVGLNLGVMKSNGGSWTPAGSLSAKIYALDRPFDFAGYNGILYLAYIDTSDSNLDLYVMKYQ